MADGSIVIDTKIDSDGYKKSLAQMQKDTSSFVGKMKTTFAGIRDVMQGPVAAAGMLIGAIVKIGKALGNLENEYLASARASAILGSTLKATGANAWTSKSQIEDMAGELQAMSGYADDTILSMQNVLLGFKNIKGDNFKEASVQILNMATVMGMDLASAAQSVGKALDDPINGIDSLSRQGFRFSDTQKAMLKGLVETGQTAKAQKIILEELATTYGGAAEAANIASNSTVDFKNAMADLAEETGRVITQVGGPARVFFADIAKAASESAKMVNDYNDAIKKVGTGEIKSVSVDDQIASYEAIIKNIEANGLAEKSYSLRDISETKMYQNQLKNAQNMLVMLKAQRDYDKLLSDQRAAGTANTAKAEEDYAKKVAASKIKTDALVAAYAEYNKQVAIAQANQDKGFFTEEEKIDAVKNAAEAYKNKLIEIMVTMGGLGKESSAMLAEMQKILSDPVALTPSFEITPETEAALNKAEEEIALLFAADMLAQQNEAAKAGRAWMKSLADGMYGAANVVSGAAKFIIKGIGVAFSAGAKIISGAFNVLSSLATLDPADMMESLDEFLDELTTFFTSTLGSLPIFAEAGAAMITGFLTGITSQLPQIVATLMGVISSISGILMENGPTWIQQGMDIIVALITGISQSMPTIMETIMTMLVSLISTVMGALPQLIIAGADMIVAMVQGFVAAFPELITAIVGNLPAIINAIVTAVPMIVTALAEATPILISAIIEAIPLIIKALVDNLPTILSAVIEIVGTIIKGIIDTLGAAISSIAKVLGDIIWQGISAILNGLIWLVNQAIGLLNKLNITIPDWVPVFGGQKWGFNIPEISYFAKGTNNSPDGKAIINEEGAELVTLPGGSKVATAAATSSMINQGIQSLLAGLGGFSAPAMASVSDTKTITLINRNYNTLQLDGRTLAEGVIENIDKVAT